MAKEEDTDGLLDDAKQDTGNIEALVETMRETNAMTRNIERDQAATREQLIAVKQLLSGESIFNTGVGKSDDDFHASEKFWHRFRWNKDRKNKQQDTEDKKEQKNVFIEIRDALKQQSTWQDPKNSKKIASGFMGKFGKMMAGAGIGVGAAGLGIAAVMGAGAYFLKTMEEIDGEKISENVKELLSISDHFGGPEGEGKFVNMFKESGSFYLMMLGLGAGLLAFSIGAGSAALVQKYEKEGWTGRIKHNVIELLSIPKAAGGGGMGGGILAVGKSGVFAMSMLGLGVGLLAFGIGQAIGGTGNAIGEFMNKDDWASRIKSNVITLLSIADEVPKGYSHKEFIKLMGGLGLGLAAFAIGKVGSGIGDAVTMFQGENFAEDIKKEVTTLLSIADIPGAQDPKVMDTFGFTMLGLAGGLAAFGAGKAIAGFADFLTMTSPGSNFAKDLKEEVITLLSIGEGDFDLENMAKFVATMGFLATGLAVFGFGKGIGAIGSALEGVVGWFTGEKSPVEQALALADRADDLDRGVDAFDRFGDVLLKFAGIKGIKGDWALEEMANDLLNASETLNIAIAGGTTGDWSIRRNRDYTGIANIEGMDDALVNMALLKSAFTIQVPTTGIDLSTAALANTEGKSSNAFVATDNSNSSVNTSSQTIVTTPQFDKTSMAMQQAGGGPGQ